MLVVLPTGFGLPFLSFQSSVHRWSSASPFCNKFGVVEAPETYVWLILAAIAKICAIYLFSMFHFLVCILSEQNTSRENKT